jgi:inorganic triphosphatase YgiF
MTGDQPLEIELKLTLPPAQVDAFRRRMARRRSQPVTQDLLTRYFDTPDFDLGGEGVALRVRRAGRRWLQTLKTEGERHGGLSRRVEFEMPVARGVPDWSRFPPEALDYVPAPLRARLVPVFETRFQRTAWQIAGPRGARVEVALDVGEVCAGACRQPLCEIELELKAGAVDALFVLALDWAAAFDCLPFDLSKSARGALLARGKAAEPVRSAPVGLVRGMSVEDGFAAICQACLAQFQANLPGVLAPLPNLLPQAGEGVNVMPKPTNDDIEYVHQARVALRRLRAALRLYRKVCALPDDLADGLRALAGALGPARDWDVLCAETLPAIAPHFDDAAAWRRGMVVLETHRAGVRAAMRAKLRGLQPGAWLLAFQRWLQTRGWRDVPEARRFVQLSPLDEWARRALAKGQRPLVRGARDFPGMKPPQRHALRIAIKRQRYAAEFFEGLYDARRQRPYLDALRAAQDSLGQSNDAHVAGLLLADAQLDTGPMGPFLRGWLAAVQAHDTAAESARHLKNFMKARPYW